jgi:dipeptidyl aminopeptidase/acylaminoacyl peptidase
VNVFRSIPLVAMIALAAAPAAHADAGPTFPIRDFFGHAERGFFRLADDGRTLAFMQPVAQADGTRRMNVFVQSLDGSTLAGAPRQLTHESGRDVPDIHWKGSRTILFQKDFGGDENFHVVAVDTVTGKVRDLTPGDKLRAEIVDDLPEDANHVLVSTNRLNPEVFDVYRIDLRTGAQALVAKNPGDIVEWDTDHAGRVRLAVRAQGVNKILLHRADEKSPWKPIIETDYRTEVWPVAFSADDRRIYATSNRGRDRKALVLIDPARPDAEEVVFAPDDVDAAAPVWSRKLKKITRMDYPTAKTAHKFFDAGTEATWARMQARIPGYELLIQSATLAEDKFIVAAVNDRTEGVRYLYDAKSDTATRLAVINPKIPEDAMAPMTPVRYTARDGLAIDGYLTLPTRAVLGGREQKGLACIVNPHGGPWVRDTWGYDPEVQFLANRGYCVLQMNYRGSTGYGRKFWEASFGQWGLKMQDDITDGVKWLVAQGIADPKRVGIYGGSYGGYATLAGVAFTPELYAAAVDYCGVSNLNTFMNTIPPYWKPEMPRYYALVGDPVRDRARLDATSPALHADRIVTPLLIAQGANDPRVNKAESDQVVEALRKRGVDVRYIVKDNEGHGFQNEENQQEFYAAMESFFADHLHPLQAAAK